MPPWALVLKRLTHTASRAPAVSPSNLHWVSITKQLSILRSKGLAWEAIQLGKSAIASKSEPAPHQVYEDLIFSIRDFIHNRKQFPSKSSLVCNSNNSQCEILNVTDPSSVDIKDENYYEYMHSVCADLALNLAYSMIQLQYSIRSEVFSVLFDLTRQAGDPLTSYALHDVWNKNTGIGSLEKRPLMSNLVLDKLACTSLESTMFALREMTKSSSATVPILYETYERILFVCCQYGEMEYAHEIMTILYNRGNTYSRTWGVFIQAAVANDAYKSVVWAWDKAIVPGSVIVDDHTYEKISQIASSRGNVSLAEQSHAMSLRRRNALATPIPANELASSVAYFSGLMDAHAIAQNIPGALDLLSRLSDDIVSNIRLDSVRHLVGSVARISQTKFLGLVTQLNNINSNANRPPSHAPFLLGVLCAAMLHKTKTKNSTSEAAVDFLRALLREMSIVPNEETLLYYLDLARRTSDIYLAKEVLEIALANNCQVSRSMLNICLDIADAVNNEQFAAALQHILEHRENTLVE